MLYLIGLGLSSAKDITVRGLEAVKTCERVYLEHYTSILMSATVEDLEGLYGKKVILADREMVESSSDDILKDADKENVAFLVVGDIFGATTHSDLVIRARELNIPVENIHNASVMNAVGACGLQLYNFGQTVSMVFFTDSWRPDSFYNKIAENRKIGLHTLILLDIKVKEQSIEALMRGSNVYEPPRYMGIDIAAQQLLEVAEKQESPIYDENTVCVAVSRLGSPTQCFKVATLKELSQYDAGPPLHSLIMVGPHPHELELEFLVEYFKGNLVQLQALF